MSEEISYRNTINLAPMMRYRDWIMAHPGQEDDPTDYTVGLRDRSDAVAARLETLLDSAQIGCRKRTITVITVVMALRYVEHRLAIPKKIVGGCTGSC